MSTRKHHKLKWQFSEKIFIVFFISILFLFAAFRSYTLDLTNDEAYSFLNIDKLNFKMMLGTANTHWLNSFFMFFENALLGSAEWKLRIHSVISIAFFAYFLIKNFKHDYSNRLILIPITMLVCNHYLFDFFSLARGYGLAIMFEILAFYYIVQHRQQTSKVYLFLCLATLSNFTFIYILLSFALLDLFNLIRDYDSKKLFTLDFYSKRWPLWLCLIFSIPIIFYIKYYTGDLEEGLKNGFIQDTLQHFVQQTYFFIPSVLLYWILIIWSIFLVVFYFKRYTQMRTGYRRLFEIYFLNIVLIYILFWILKVPYPYGRTSFFIIVLFLFLSAYVIMELLKYTPRLLQWIVPSLIFVLNLSYIYTYRTQNVTMEWWMQQGLKEFCKDLSTHNNKNVKQLKLGMSIDHYGSFDNYYRYLNKSKLPDSIFVYSRADYKDMPENLKSQFSKQDYLLLVNNYQSFLDSQVEKSSYKLIKNYSAMRSDLIQLIKD